jgi:hypothetical protein
MFRGATCSRRSRLRATYIRTHVYNAARIIDPQRSSRQRYLRYCASLFRVSQTELFINVIALSREKSGIIHRSLESTNAFLSEIGIER